MIFMALLRASVASRLAIVSGLFFRPLVERLSFLLCSSDKGRPRCPSALLAMRLAICSGDCLRPFMAMLMRCRTSFEWRFPLFAKDSFLRHSGVKVLPLRAARNFSTSLADFIRPVLAFRSFSLCSLESRFPFRAALNLDRVASVATRPIVEPATGATLYPLRTASSDSIQNCSLASNVSRYGQSVTSISSNVKACSPYLFQALCSFRLWCRFSLSWALCSLHRNVKLSALPTYTLPDARCLIRYIPDLSSCMTKLYLRPLVIA